MIKINRVIKILIISDIVFLTGFGLIAPVFALFIAQKITFDDPGEAAKVTGFAMAIYWSLKSILNIPVGRYLDSRKGEKDDLLAIIFGYFLSSLSAFGYLFAKKPTDIYFLKAIFAIAMALNIPSWTAVFTRHIDKGKEALEWAIRSTAIGVGTGISGAIGGIIVKYFGFNILFILVGSLALLSCFLPLFIWHQISKRKEKVPPPIIKSPFLEKHD